MTPKEKCDELVEKFNKYFSVMFSTSGDLLRKEKIKACALICADQVVNELEGSDDQDF